jgi:phosphatidylglycerol lysyltransferase
VQTRYGRFKQEWPVWLVAFVTFANGLVSILAILLVRFRQPRVFGVIFPFGGYHWTRSITVALGFILIYLSYNLLQRRRVAWWLALIISVPVLVSHLLHPRLWPAAFVPALTIGLLLYFRQRFRVRSEVSNIWQGLILLGISVAVAIGYGTLGFWLLSRRDFGITFNPLDSLVRTLRGFTLVGNNDLVAHTRFARWFLESLNVLGVVAGAFAVYSLFRPVANRLNVLLHDQNAATGAIKQYGQGSYDYFKDKPGKTYYFSRSHRTFISYRTVSGVALCLGDATGPEEEVEKTTTDFLSFCSDNAWLVSFLVPDRTPMYRKMGFSLLKIGEEASVNLEHFQTRTVNRKYFRYIRRKMEGEGNRFTRSKPPHPPELLDEVERVSREWLTLPHHREFGFFQEVFSRRYIAETNLCCVRDSAGQLIAWVNEVPSFRPGEATFDMMRHRPGTHWGVMDYLFTNLMLALHQEGFITLNMGLAPLAGVGENPQATLLEKAVHQIYERIGRVVSMKGLRQYKIKFEPSWEERFIAYQGGAVGLIRIGLAISRVL